MYFFLASSLSWENKVQTLDDYWDSWDNAANNSVNYILRLLRVFDNLCMHHKTLFFDNFKSIRKFYGFFKSLAPWNAHHEIIPLHSSESHSVRKKPALTAKTLVNTGSEYELAVLPIKSRHLDWDDFSSFDINSTSYCATISKIFWTMQGGLFCKFQKMVSHCFCNSF